MSIMTEWGVQNCCCRPRSSRLAGSGTHAGEAGLTDGGRNALDLARGEVNDTLANGACKDGEANLHRAGFADLVEHLNAPSHLALPRLIEDGLSIQFAFIDGWHTFDYVLVDFFLIDHLLDVGGVIAFDDANNPAIQQVLRYILANRRYEVISDQRVGGATGDGLRARLVGGLHRLVDRLGPRPRPVMVNSADLGLPEVRCVVLRKIADDVLGDGSNGSRRWNDHTQF